ncbi:conserved hypothetical protein [Culex quinquefasciatus]|uniref:Uncharacterized protein n=1 Tax=Culex quinquefasciatus TaxID=7176 RepID=B0X591_CULQU|nr:conserved hypothetical protein [Culex quinquefasciatus]|eukprot:XP_001864813.1 conserved hypothetical protein [Culex quinquefasciatus]
MSEDLQRRVRSPSLSSSYESGGGDGVVQRCAVYLSIVALALTGLGYDPLQRIVEQKVAAEAEVDAEYEGFYAGIEEELDEEGDLEINYQPNVYLGRVFGPTLICGLLARPVDLQLVRRIYGLGHLFVALCYVLLMLPSDGEGDRILQTCGFLSELFWSGKLVLYFYQIIVYSSPNERFPGLVYGIIVQSFGSAVLPWILNELEEIWPETQYYLNILHAVKESFPPSSNLKFPKLVAISSAIAVILTSLCNVTLQWFLTDPSPTLLRPFLPLLIADDFLATLWNVLYTFISFTFLGFFTLFFSPVQVLIASLLATLTAGASYLYLEEEIPARLALPATAFTFAVALHLLLELCPERRSLVPLVGTVFTVANAATYGYFGLLTLLWESPDVVIIVLWAALGFFALAVLVLCRELEQRKEAGGIGEQQRDVSSGSFRTVITTIA